MLHSVHEGSVLHNGCYTESVLKTGKETMATAMDLGPTTGLKVHQFGVWENYFATLLKTPPPLQYLNASSRIGNVNAFREGTEHTLKSVETVFSLC